MARHYLINLQTRKTQSDKDLQLFTMHIYNCTLRFFSENNTLMFAQADKGKITIVLPIDTYRDKMKNLLLDRNTYTPINVSSHNSYATINERLLKKLSEVNLINATAISSILANEQKIANVYGLIKVHKENAPLRPVVNTRSTPGYTIAKAITNILTPAKETHKYNIQNTRHLLQKLEHIEPEPMDIFATVDIRDMFTNVTTDMAIQAIRKRYAQGKIDRRYPLELILDCIKFVTGTATEIEFDEFLYKQIRGLRMGGSLSTILADFVVEDILDETLKRTLRPKLLAKYIDDCLLYGKRHILRQFIELLNTHETRLQFLETYEDVDQSIVYLDLRLFNQPQDAVQIKSSWYTKPMASGRLVNYRSAHQMSTINNTAISYVRHMLAITHHSMWTEMIEKAIEILHLNSFPRHIASGIIREAKQRVITDNNAHKTIGTHTNTHSTSNNAYSYTNNDWIADGTQLHSWDERDPYSMEWIKPKEHIRYISLPHIPNVTPRIGQEIKRLRPNTITTGAPMNTMRTMNDKQKNLRGNNDIDNDKNRPKYVKYNTQPHRRA